MHKNNMTVWDAIECQRGHATHDGVEVLVDLGQRHGYRDLPQIPQRFARKFTMNVWPPDVYPVDGGPYCPAHDAVSETIVSHRIWEPRETIAALQVCTGDDSGWVVDFGAQLGWFSLLAASCGRDVIAYEADPANARLLDATFLANGWDDQIEIHQERIGPTSAPHTMPIRFAKIDIEGAERDAVRMLWPLIEAGQVDHLMIEISPVFDDYYPDLVAQLISAGFDAYLLPPKRNPPVRLERFPDDLVPLFTGDPVPGELVMLRALVASWHQEDVWFARRGASW